jgi:hypothetical protein
MAAAIRARTACRTMIELIRTNDLVLIGFAESLLSGAEIPVLVADNHISMMEGMIGAFPRRLLVPEDHARQARRILTDAGLAHELRDAPRP